ncbi:cache domain-containing sensor histidine kinase [Paenibacillus flagellatus]|uniref:histidine kinase n=1 Tax=Paenibacillus flagellatus TaxID=2211139 RepID=A0A2V5K164_9BACL|nr:sensor histidine kinase [Paenibacillus flagellatus]PYI52858.1 two-component sensor histidine kinase [Paenibacillus flagellatus]
MVRKPGSVTIKLFAICFVFVLATVLTIGFLSYRYIEDELRKNEFYYANQLLDKVGHYLDVYFVSMQNTLMNLSTPADSWTGSPQDAQSQLDRVYGYNIGYITNAYLIKPDLTTVGGSPLGKVFTDPLPEREPVYRQALAHPASQVISEPYRSAYSGWTVTLSRKVQWSGEPAVAALDLDLQALEERLSQLGRTDSLKIGIVSSKGMRVSGSSSYLSETGTEGLFTLGTLRSEDLAASNETVLTAFDSSGHPFTVMKRSMGKFNWTVYMILDETRFRTTKRALETYFVGLTAAGLLMSAAVALLVARYIRKPVQALMRKMRLVKAGDLRATVNSRRNDEFGELADTFDSMLGQIRELIDHLGESREMKRKLEIQVLQSQINPHFLYNTLGTIGNVVELERYEEVDPIIASLVSILEYGIADASEAVRLQDEFDNVRHYLYIQNIRYGQAFELVLTADPELIDYPLFRMMLQPIVENSLFHGYAGGTIQGPIRISVYRGEDAVVIEVADDGIGMPADKVRGLLQPDAGSSGGRASRRRIGLYNIHKRIQLYYGEAYGLDIRSEPGKGTSVQARFPLVPVRDLKPVSSLLGKGALP